MKIIIRLPNNYYIDPDIVLIGHHRGRCNIIDRRIRKEFIYYMCNFDIPDELTALKDFSYKYFSNSKNSWRELMNDGQIWYYFSISS
jgi:hypothetical protein